MHQKRRFSQERNLKKWTCGLLVFLLFIIFFVHVEALLYSNIISAVIIPMDSNVLHIVLIDMVHIGSVQTWFDEQLPAQKKISVSESDFRQYKHGNNNEKRKQENTHKIHTPYCISDLANFKCACNIISSLLSGRRRYSFHVRKPYLWKFPPCLQGKHCEMVFTFY